MVKVPDCDSGKMGSIPVIRPKKKKKLSYDMIYDMIYDIRATKIIWARLIPWWYIILKRFWIPPSLIAYKG